MDGWMMGRWMDGFVCVFVLMLLALSFEVKRTGMVLWEDPRLGIRGLQFRSQPLSEAMKCTDLLTICLPR